MKSNQAGTLSRSEFVARLRNLADEIESGTLTIEDEMLVLPRALEVSQSAAASRHKASYTLRLDWTATESADRAGERESGARPRARGRKTSLES